MKIKMIDCTMRDGGYYNRWDFSSDLINEYLIAMDAAKIDYVELGFRSFERIGFKGACAYTTDDFISSLVVPPSIKIGVMMNGAEIVQHPLGPLEAIKLQFLPAAVSPVSLVRLACHIDEFERTLEACAWLKKVGYQVGINLMQITERTESEIERIGRIASQFSIDVLYFSDTLGSMDVEQTAHIIQILKRTWKGVLGIHTHDNMGKAVANTLVAIDGGVTWVDSTVTGMGRGPGNAQTEYMVLERERITGLKVNITPLLALIRRHFGPMQNDYGWGKNPYYYLAGQYGIHPTYVQEMLSDTRYDEADILFMLEHLKSLGSKKFSAAVMEAGRSIYCEEAVGSWSPSTEILDREVLILGSGPSLTHHKEAMERYIKQTNPYVIALNTLQVVDANLIDLRAACHPFRLVADCEAYKSLEQPIAMPIARVLDSVKHQLLASQVRDFGMTTRPDTFIFNEKSAIVPSSLVIAYALAIASSGKAKRVLLAGFDGYGVDDPRTKEINDLLVLYQGVKNSAPILAITPTRFHVPASSVYALL